MVIQLTKPPLPPSSETRIESMLEQIPDSQTKLVVEFNGKFDAVYIYLNGKIDNPSSHLKKLDVQVAQTTQSIKRLEGFLPVILMLTQGRAVMPS